MMGIMRPSSGSWWRRLAARRRPLGQSGQTLAEIGIVLPMLMIITVATFQVGYYLYQGHVVRKVAREAANMISRQVSLQQTADAIRDYSIPYVGSFTGNAKLVLSVVQLGTSGTNAGLNIITQQVTVGSLGGTSILGDPGAGAFGPAPNYRALDPAGNSALRTGALPNGLGTLAAAETIFIAELWVDRKDMATMVIPGVNLDEVLYANSFF